MHFFGKKWAFSSPYGHTHTRTVRQTANIYKYGHMLLWYLILVTVSGFSEICIISHTSEWSFGREVFQEVSVVGTLLLLSDFIYLQSISQSHSPSNDYLRLATSLTFKTPFYAPTNHIVGGYLLRIAKNGSPYSEKYLIFCLKMFSPFGRLSAELTKHTSLLIKLITITILGGLEMIDFLEYSNTIRTNCIEVPTSKSAQKVT